MKTKISFPIIVSVVCMGALLLALFVVITTPAKVRANPPSNHEEVFSVNLYGTVVVVWKVRIDACDYLVSSEGHMLHKANCPNPIH